MSKFIITCAPRCCWAQRVVDSGTCPAESSRALLILASVCVYISFALFLKFFEKSSPKTDLSLITFALSLSLSLRNSERKKEERKRGGEGGREGKGREGKSHVVFWTECGWTFGKRGGHRAEEGS